MCVVLSSTLYCIVHCAVLYTVLYCTVQRTALYIVLYCVLYCIVHCIVLYIVLYYTLYCTVHCIVLCAAPCCTLYCTLRIVLYCILVLGYLRFGATPCYPQGPVSYLGVSLYVHNGFLLAHLWFPYWRTTSSLLAPHCFLISPLPVRMLAPH